MRGAMHPLPQYAFMAQCSVKSIGTILLLLTYAMTEVPQFNFNKIQLALFEISHRKIYVRNYCHLLIGTHGHKKSAVTVTWICFIYILNVGTGSGNQC
jgi:hypothetical protein